MGSLARAACLQHYNVLPAYMSSFPFLILHTVLINNTEISSIFEHINYFNFQINKANYKLYILETKWKVVAPKITTKGLKENWLAPLPLHHTQELMLRLTVPPAHEHQCDQTMRTKINEEELLVLNTQMGI